MAIVLGAIADDFTGATDLCNTLVREGMRTVQVIGVPNADTDPGDAEAAVVALKSRTAASDLAIDQSLAAYDWLVAQGAEQIIEKYCSTFDSTPQGNIGPVTDALMERADAKIVVVCPAVPEAGRTVYQGHLFVWGDLLSDSSMKNHPLTPMRDSSLVRLMERQSKGSAGVVPLQTVRQGSEAIRAALSALAAAGHRYAVTDAIEAKDLRAIGSAVSGYPIVSGGSGIALGLPENLGNAGRIGLAEPASPPSACGRMLVLAGSCSTVTRAQITRASSLWPAKKLDIDSLAEGQDAVSEYSAWAMAQPEDQPVLIYGSADPEEVAANQARYGRTRTGEMIEAALGELAKSLSIGGFRNIIVAGGETSGAVVSALGVKALRIGSQIAPGVPWTETIGDPPIALVLKSGNFGGETFFEDAFGMLT